METPNEKNMKRQVANEIKLTFVEPQQRQKCTSSVEPGSTQMGVLNGKNIANLQKGKKMDGLRN